jgi:hypothetical protein
MDKKPLFVLYSVVAITIVLSFSSIDAQTTVNSPSGNITSATKSMGESMANQSSAVVGNLSESVASAASNETESIVNQTANTAANMTQNLSTNSTT